MNKYAAKPSLGHLRPEPHPKGATLELVFVGSVIIISVVTIVLSCCWLVAEVQFGRYY